MIFHNSTIYCTFDQINAAGKKKEKTFDALVWEMCLQNYWNITSVDNKM